MWIFHVTDCVKFYYSSLSMTSECKAMTSVVVKIRKQVAKIQQHSRNRLDSLQVENFSD